jgi:hypothetical protein
LKGTADSAPGCEQPLAEGCSRAREWSAGPLRICKGLGLSEGLNRPKPEIRRIGVAWACLTFCVFEMVARECLQGKRQTGSDGDSYLKMPYIDKTTDTTMAARPTRYQLRTSSLVPPLHPHVTADCSYRQDCTAGEGNSLGCEAVAHGERHNAQHPEHRIAERGSDYRTETHPVG